MKDIKVDVKENKAEIITTKEFPKEIQKIVTDKLKEIVPSIKEYNFKK